MPWHTVIINPSLVAFVAAEGRFPYLTALALTPPPMHLLMRQRLNNFNIARIQESTHPSGPLVGMPYHLVVDPSSACNLRCPLCVQATDPDGRRRTFVSLEHHHKLISNVKQHAIRVDLFNWGEPLINPNFTDIVKITVDAGLYTRTSSNLSLANVDAQAIVASGLNYLVASVDGATQETYEQYRVRGHLATCLKLLKAISDAKRAARTPFPIVEWQYLVMRHNRHEIDAALELARSCGADVFRYGGARARMAAKTLQSDVEAYKLSEGVLLTPEDELSEYRTDGERKRQDEKLECRWLWGKMSLNADGGVSPCWNGWFKGNDLGDWQRDTLSDIWNGAQFQSARQTVRSGGSEKGMCGVCAARRNFVPTPDYDREDPYDPAASEVICAAMDAVGRPPPIALLSELRKDLVVGP